jgi:HK97 family phage prohead protease
MPETKDLRLELKAVNEDGTFEGYLSVYDVVDLGNDLVEKGSFTKTIQETKGIIPMLWHHDPKIPLGALNLSDDDHGLKVDGQFFLEESEKAREMHGMSKRYFAIGRPMGMSIGYDAIKKAMQGAVRHLKEIKLYEGSLTLFPMLPIAQMTGIKSFLPVDGKADFQTELAESQLRAMRGMMVDSLVMSLATTLWADTPATDKLSESADSIDQFRTAYLEFLPTLLDYWGIKSDKKEAKAGRRISASTRIEIEDAVAKLQALLSADESTSESEAADAKAGAAMQHKNEPDSLHSYYEIARKGVTILCQN